MRRILLFAVGIAMFLGLSIPTQLNAQVYGEFSSVSIVSPVSYDSLKAATEIPSTAFGIETPAFIPDVDDGYAKIPIGFSFEFAGVPYTELYVCVNGFVTFTKPPVTPSKVQTALFNYANSYPINVVAPYWGDHYYRLETDMSFGYTKTTISYKVLTLANGKRVLVIEWKDLNINDATIQSSIADFQVRLYESVDPLSYQGDIEFCYGQIGGNTNTPLQTVITRNATVGIKGDFNLLNDKTDFLNGLAFGKPLTTAKTVETLTNEWTPSGATDKRIKFTALTRYNIEEWWGDGDADLSKGFGQKHFGMEQNRFVTVNDARKIINSLSSLNPLDSVRRRAAYHGDVNHNGRFYYSNTNVRKDIPWKDKLYSDNLPAEINTVKRVYYQVTEYDAALILHYIGARLPELPWILDTIPQYGKINNTEFANNFTVGAAQLINDGTYTFPVSLNGYINGPVAGKFNVNGEVVSVSTNNSSEQEIISDFSSNIVTIAARGIFDANSPVAFITVKTNNPTVELSNVRFNDINKENVTINVAKVNEVNNNSLLNVTPNVVDTKSTITVNVPADGAYTVAIFDAMGNVVKTLSTSELSVGLHSFDWNGTNDANANLATGLYIVRVNGNNINVTSQVYKY